VWLSFFYGAQKDFFWRLFLRSFPSYFTHTHSVRERCYRRVNIQGIIWIIYSHNILTSNQILKKFQKKCRDVRFMKNMILINPVLKIKSWVVNSTVEVKVVSERKCWSRLSHTKLVWFHKTSHMRNTLLC